MDSLPFALASACRGGRELAGVDFTTVNNRLIYYVVLNRTCGSLVRMLV